MRFRALGSLGLVAIVLTATAADALAQATEPLAFDVVSVKENKSGDDGVSMIPSPSGITITNATLQMIMRLAYRIQDDQIIGGPDWLTKARFDVAGKRSSTVPLAFDDLRPMLRAVLNDRFRLMTRAETREIPVYALITARTDGKLGPQLRLPSNCVPQQISKDRQDGPQRACSNNVLAGSMSSRGVTMWTLAVNLSVFVGRSVVDRTGIPGTFDYELVWSPDLAIDGPNAGTSERPSLFAALKEQLGLKLESTKAPVEVVVIAHIERPTEN